MEKEKVAKTPATTSKKTQSKLEFPVYDIAGKSTGTQAVSDDIFAAKDNPTLIAQYIRVYMINQRQGNAQAKTRAEIVGSTKKIYRQKGTGRARHGAAKAPIFVGGGVAGGPRSKTYSKSINKKQKKQALFISLTNKLKNGSILGLAKEAEKIEPETKRIADFLKNIKMSGKKVVFLVSKLEKNGFVLSIRNIPNVKVLQVTTVNPYEVMKNDVVVFVGDAIETLENHFLEKNENK